MGANDRASAIFVSCVACRGATKHEGSTVDAGAQVIATPDASSEGGPSAVTSDSGAGDGATNDAAVPDALPVTSPPTLPMGSQGWRNSTALFCAEGHVSPGARVWSTDGLVYIHTTTRCPGPEAICDTDAYLYKNDGSGWQRIYTAQNEGATTMTGYSDGRVVLVGDNACVVKEIDPDGIVTCLRSDATAFYPHAAAVTATGDLLVLSASTDDPYARVDNAVELWDFDGMRWTSLAAWNDGLIYALAVSGTTAVVAGAYRAWTVDLKHGTTTMLPNVPAGGYGAVWTYGAGDILLGNYAGGLAHYDGSRWTTLNTRLTLATGTAIWGALDGSVFIRSASALGRYKAGSFESIFDAGINGPIYFSDMWGNSSTEVFFVGQALGSMDDACGSLWVTWFDGTSFHRF